MRLSSDIRTFALGATLAVTQVIGWATTFSPPAVLARPISGDLVMPLSEAMAGPSAFLVGMAVASRLLVSAYGRFGAARILAAGSFAMALALAGLAVVPVRALYLPASALVGFAGAAALTTSAHALLAERTGAAAKNWIVTVMLASGLAGSIGLAVAAFLLDAVGWRGTYLVFAALNLFVCLPMHLFLVRGNKEGIREETAVTAPKPADAAGRERAAFFWLAVSVSLIGFVSWGFAIVIVELLRARGLTLERAVGLATVVGIASTGARLVEFVLARTMSAVRKATFAAAAMAASFVLLAYGGGASAALLFVIFYGFASGTMSVARSTIPLELFDSKAYGTMVSRLSLPMHLAFAAAPFVFGLVLESLGPLAAAALAFVSCLAALGALLALAASVKEKTRGSGRTAG